MSTFLLCLCIHWSNDSLNQSSLNEKILYVPCCVILIMQTVGLYKATSLDQRQLKVQVNEAESGLYGRCGGSMKPSMSISSSVS